MDTLQPIFVMSHDGADAGYRGDAGDDDDGANICCASKTPQR